MEFRHGGLSIDLPPTWADRSTLVFVAPQVQAAGLPTMADVETPTEVVRIEFLMNPERDAKGFLSAQVGSIVEGDPSFVQQVDEGAFSCGLGEGWQVTLRASLEGYTTRQILVAIARGDIVVLASAIAADDRFDQRRTELVSILQSLRGAE